jgi:hypothetical protein
MVLTVIIQHAIACLNSRKTRPQASLDDMRGSDDMMSWINIIGYLVLYCLFSIPNRAYSYPGRRFEFP